MALVKLGHGALPIRVTRLRSLPNSSALTPPSSVLQDCVTREHLDHHHKADGREQYFGLVPGGCLVVFSVWQTW